MDHEDRIFDLMYKMHKEMQEGFIEVNRRIDDTEKEISSIKKIVVNIKNDHGHKLAALFDRYLQNADKLIRIEEEVSKHEETILRRIR